MTIPIQIGFKIPVGDGTPDQRIFQFHKETTSIQEIMAWIKQFNTGYIDIAVENNIWGDSKQKHTTFRRNIPVNSEHVIMTILSNFQIRALKWKKYVTNSIQDGG